jgi:hypothetical protein
MLLHLYETASHLLHSCSQDLKLCQDLSTLKIHLQVVGICNGGGGCDGKPCFITRNFKHLNVYHSVRKQTIP